MKVKNITSQTSTQFDNALALFRQLYGSKKTIPLHEPLFVGHEKTYLMDTIDSTFVSSVGAYVDKFEKLFSEFVGAKYAIAVSNGTCALHLALIANNISSGDEVITQPFTFVGTCNAIVHAQAEPVFIDIDKRTLGLSAESLEAFLINHTKMVGNNCINTVTGRVVRACIPMHTFGFPCEMDKITQLCEKSNIVVIEDAAEAVGSRYKDRHVGTFGTCGVFSFNGNKIITTGGGGMVVTDDFAMAKHLKHLSTTARIQSGWEFVHDQVGYNYRMPNLNAALGVAQLENIEKFLKAKRNLANEYKAFFESYFDVSSDDSLANYWLNTLCFENKKIRDQFLLVTNNAGIMTRPPWKLMFDLPMYAHCYSDAGANSRYYADRIANIPSTPIL